MNTSECIASPPQSADRGWRQSLYTGAAGIALLHIEYAHAGLSSWDRAHEWVTAMTRDPIIADPCACGLYQGAPAIAFVLHAAGQPAYTAALETLDHHITAVTVQRLQQAHQRIDSGRLPALNEFDLISGLTGIGVYLLRHGRQESLLRDVLAYLVRLTEPVTTAEHTLPGWWSRHAPTDQPSKNWPEGHANLGVAHGISGPLMLLSMAFHRDVIVVGQSEAIDRICSWLDRWRISAGTRVWWPGTISLQEWRTGFIRQSGPPRPSWCYGTPGLARAQQLAGLALGDRKRQRVAEQSMVGCVADERQLSQLEDASLCHGWAGILHIATRMTADAGTDTELTAHLPHLMVRLERQLMHDPPVHNGLAEGRAGVRLAQHAYRANRPPHTGWDSCLLLGT